MKPPDLPEHDPCGPSALGRLIACPASYRLSAGEPNIADDDAKEGTALHVLVYQWLKEHKFPKATKNEHRELVFDCVRFVEEKLAGLEPLDEWAEQWVELCEGDEYVNGGTLDLVVLTSGRAFLFDWKFGRIVRRHQIVLQLANYAAAAAQTLLHQGAGVEPLAMECWAYFPRLARSFQWKTPDIWAEIAAVIERIWGVIERAEADKEPAVPGPWCDRCRHLARCAEVKALAARELARRPEALLERPGEVSAIYDAGALAVKQYEALRARIREILEEDPEALPGLELREVGGRRRVTDIGELKQNLLDAGLLTGGEFEILVERNVRPVALEEAFLAKAYKGRSEGPSKKELRKRLAAAAGKAIYQATEKRLRRTDDGSAQARNREIPEG